MSRPRYSTLASHYSMDRHGCPDIATSIHECAVRVSRALIAAGIPMDSDYTNQLCRHGYARGAQDLGAFLVKKWGPRDVGFEEPNQMPSQMRDKKGVVLFANIPGFGGQGHIDLWNGRRILTEPPEEYWNANPIWFWELEE